MNPQLQNPSRYPPIKYVYAALALVLFIIASQGHLVHRADAGGEPATGRTSTELTARAD